VCESSEVVVDLSFVGFGKMGSTRPPAHQFTAAAMGLGGDGMSGGGVGAVASEGGDLSVSWHSSMSTEDRRRVCQHLLTKMQSMYSTVADAALRQWTVNFEKKAFIRAGSRDDYLEYIAKGLTDVQSLSEKQKKASGPSATSTAAALTNPSTRTPAASASHAEHSARSTATAANMPTMNRESSITGTAGGVEPIAGARSTGSLGSSQQSKGSMKRSSAAASGGAAGLARKPRQPTKKQLEEQRKKAAAAAAAAVAGQNASAGQAEQQGQNQRVVNGAARSVEDHKRERELLREKVSQKSPEELLRLAEANQNVNPRAAELLRRYAAQMQAAQLKASSSQPNASVGAATNASYRSSNSTAAATAAAAAVAAAASQNGVQSAARNAANRASYAAAALVQRQPNQQQQRLQQRQQQHRQKQSLNATAVPSSSRGAPNSEADDKLPDLLERQSSRPAVAGNAPVNGENASRDEFWMYLVQIQNTYKDLLLRIYPRLVQLLERSERRDRFVQHLNDCVKILNLSKTTSSLPSGVTVRHLQQVEQFIRMVFRNFRELESRHAASSASQTHAEQQQPASTDTPATGANARRAKTASLGASAAQFVPAAAAGAQQSKPQATKTPSTSSLGSLSRSANSGTKKPAPARAQKPKPKEPVLPAARAPPPLSSGNELDDQPDAEAAVMSTASAATQLANGVGEKRPRMTELLASMDDAVKLAVEAAARLPGMAEDEMQRQKRIRVHSTFQSVVGSGRDAAARGAPDHATRLATLGLAPDCTFVCTEKSVLRSKVEAECTAAQGRHPMLALEIWEDFGVPIVCCFLDLLQIRFPTLIIRVPRAYANACANPVLSLERPPLGWIGVVEHARARLLERITNASAMPITVGEILDCWVREAEASLLSSGATTLTS